MDLLACVATVAANKHYHQAFDIQGPASNRWAFFYGNGCDNTYRIDSNQWETANFTWTPTGINTGDFSISWTAPANAPLSRGPMTVTGFTFDSNEIYFGFGTGRDLVGLVTSGTPGNGVVRIDNISITGSEIFVPEPASIVVWSFLGLGLAGFAVRGRRSRK